jgi:predicted phage terminase large subunit-like protein
MDELRALLERKKAILKAREGLIDFARYLTPSPDAPDDVAQSNYRDAKHHRVLGAALEEVEAGAITRLIVNMPPRHGKTKLATHLFVPWFEGRNPECSTIVATYGEHFSWDHGRAVRGIMKSPLYGHVFPNVKLQVGSAAQGRQEIEGGGTMFFLGRGSGITGRGGDGILLDDPIKNRAEADSVLIREQLWTWYTQVLQTRLMTKSGWIVIIQTRWHEDDLVGRLTDPRNPCFTEQEAKKWRIIDFPAIAGDNDILGRAPGEALWPERFDDAYLQNIKTTDKRGFQALYQGSPSPEDGSFFRDAWIRTYKRMSDLPDKSRLKYYGASDHAVSTAQGRDKTCLLIVGVDEDDQIWLMPDLFWQQADTKTVVEAMVHMIERYNPLFWWAEKGHISRSIGPFLRKRMMEKRVFCSIDEIVPNGDKEARAQSFQGRTAMGKVIFPNFPRWWADAHDQMMKFPQGAHDDFVDACSLIGLGLGRVRGSRTRKPEKPKNAFMTLGWVKEETKRQQREVERVKTGEGW